MKQSHTFQIPENTPSVTETCQDICEQTRKEREDVIHVPQLFVKKLSESAQIPIRGTDRAAGYDLFSAYDYVIASNGKELIKTDISLAIPIGYYGRIAPRSSLAWKHHIDVGAGVIDEDYRGPLGVVLFNHGYFEFKVTKGDRVAQLIITKIITPEIVEVEDLEVTTRGSGGFGSTGINDVVSTQNSDRGQI